MKYFKHIVLLCFLFSTNIVLIFLIYKIRHRNEKKMQFCLIQSWMVNFSFLLYFFSSLYISLLPPSSLLPSLHLLPSFFLSLLYSVSPSAKISWLPTMYQANIYARKCIIKYLLVTDIKGLLSYWKSYPFVM